MGYEVMDAGGTRHDTAPNESVPPIEVIELNPDDVHAVPLATRLAAWRTALARARAANRSVLLAAGAALVIGALAGGLVTGARDAASLAADRQRSQLAVVAQVESSSARLQNATVRIDVTAHVTNLGSEPVDLITIVDTTHHLQNRPTYFAALKRSLTPSGRVAIIDFKPGSKRGPPDEAKISAENVVAELRQAGFALEARHEFLPDQYFLIFKQGS